MEKSERFEQFVKERARFSDWEDYISRDKVCLLRKKIIEECNFPRSTLYQNPAVKKRLHEVETELQRLGVLRQRDLLPGTSLDEPCIQIAITELNSRLDNLDKFMAVLVTSIEEVRRQVNTFDKG